MIFQLFRRTRDDPSIASLYGTIVAQARAKALYQHFGVPDTVNGRLEMILLHVVLLLRRLNDEPDGAPLGQAVFDLFCQDMDDNLREMGVGDLAVPQRDARIGEAFYGRQAAYVGGVGIQRSGAAGRGADAQCARGRRRRRGACRLCPGRCLGFGGKGYQASCAAAICGFPDPASLTIELTMEPSPARTAHEPSP